MEGDAGEIDVGGEEAGDVTGAMAVVQVGNDKLYSTNCKM